MKTLLDLIILAMQVILFPFHTNKIKNGTMNCTAKNIDHARLYKKNSIEMQKLLLYLTAAVVGVSNSYLTRQPHLLDQTFSLLPREFLINIFLDILKYNNRTFTKCAALNLLLNSEPMLRYLQSRMLMSMKHNSFFLYIKINLVKLFTDSKVVLITCKKYLEVLHSS